MPFEGNLEDIPVEDIIQLLHFAQKSGRLRLQDKKHGRACLTFKNGAITSASHPGSGVDIGNILRELDTVSQDALEKAVTRQKGAGEDRKPLVATLVEMGELDCQEASEGLVRLVERVVQDIISWRRGSFKFNIDDAAFEDDFRYVPEQVVEELNLDTQMILMDALRIFDERNRDETEPQAKAETDVQQDEPLEADSQATSIEEEQLPTDNKHAEADDAGEDKPEEKIEAAPHVAQVIPMKGLRNEGAQTGDGDSAAMIEESARPTASEILGGIGEDETDGILDSLERSAEEKQESSENTKDAALIFSQDGYIKYLMNSYLKEHGVYAYISPIWQDLLPKMQVCLDEGILPLIVIDLSEPTVDARDLRKAELSIKKIQDVYPEAGIIVICSKDNLDFCCQWYQLGIRTILPRPANDQSENKVFAELLQSCVMNVFRERRAFLRRTTVIQNQMSILKRRVQQFQTRNDTQEISLAVLEHMAEGLERAIIFLVRKTDLLGLGAFGLDQQVSENLTSIMKIKIPLTEPSIFSRTVKDGITFHGEAQDSILEEHLFKKIEAPFCKEILLLPLKSEDKTILVIYGDFGRQDSSAVLIDSLEILANQAGLAFENALLRKQLAARKKPGSRTTKAN
jgi:Domain of unknown function (DUF4388)